MMIQHPRYSNVTCNVMVVYYGSHGSFSGITCRQLFHVPPGTFLGPPVCFCFGSEKVKCINKIALQCSSTLSKRNWHMHNYLFWNDYFNFIKYSQNLCEFYTSTVFCRIWIQRRKMFIIFICIPKHTTMPCLC